ncbi:hypothetical protein C8R43DRAFT_644960 [Mycena crocata]|nr:hypothetical protein C8R43DRAFT_644960 [Mycena crocata]
MVTSKLKTITQIQGRKGLLVCPNQKLPNIRIGFVLGTVILPNAASDFSKFEVVLVMRVGRARTIFIIGGRSRSKAARPETSGAGISCFLVACAHIILGFSPRILPVTIRIETSSSEDLTRRDDGLDNTFDRVKAYHHRTTRTVTRVDERRRIHHAEQLLVVVRTGGTGYTSWDEQRVRNKELWPLHFWQSCGLIKANKAMAYVRAWWPVKASETMPGHLLDWETKVLCSCGPKPWSSLYATDVLV